MDFKQFFKVCIFVSILSIQVICISESDKTATKNFILKTQDAKTGLFNNDWNSTYKSVSALKNLNLEVPNTISICRELNFELEKNPTNELLELDQLLNCKTDTKRINFKNVSNIDDSSSFQNIYDYLRLAETNKFANEFKNLNFEKIFNNLLQFKTSKNLFAKEKSSTRGDLQTTGQALQLLSIIAQKFNNDNVKDLTQKTYEQVSKYFQGLSEASGLFTDSSTPNLSSHSLNSLFLNAFERLSKIQGIKTPEKVNGNQFKQKLLNYLNENRFGLGNNLEATYHILNSAKVY